MFCIMGRGTRATRILSSGIAAVRVLDQDFNLISEECGDDDFPQDPARSWVILRVIFF